MPPTTNATVTVGDITFDDSLANYAQEGDANAGNAFTDYQISNRYHYSCHRYMLGITSPAGFNGQSVAFVQLASPTLLWIVDWTAARFGKAPDVPDPTPTNPDWVLLDVMPDAAGVVVSPDGVTGLFRLSGAYVYGHKNPGSSPLNKVTFPQPPWLNGTFPRTIPASALKKTIAEPAGAQGTLTPFVQGQ